MKKSIDNDLQLLRHYQPTITTGILIDASFFENIEDVDYCDIDSAKFDLMMGAVSRLTNLEQMIEQLSDVVNDMKLHMMNKAYDVACAMVNDFYPELENEIVAEVRRHFAIA